MAGKTQYQLNKEIESFIQDKDKGKESYSQADIEFIQKYEGSGGQGNKGATGEGILYEFYTPDYVVKLMWELAFRYGFDKSGTVLEPSTATGRLIEPAPDKTKCVGFEINPISARIAEVSYPGATIYRGYFETAFMQPERFTKRLPLSQLTWIKEYPFSLVIGNPPYGKYRNKYSSYFPTPKIPQIEQFFMYYGLQLLKPGGLLIYLTSSNFLRNGLTYNKAKDEIGKFAELVDAYRLPPVFRFSVVPTDIIVFKRK
jgi:type I restriction-modification system DNA methylase subunit